MKPSMKSSLKPSAVPLLASGLVAAVLPWSAAPAHAEETRPFSGYSTAASSTPVLLEIYEPTIPVPATPQAELSFGYSRVEADSSSSQGRASYLWPGDPVGEGLKTIVEQLGLPPELAGPIAARGYPVQVNSAYPAGPESAADEPFPGTVMRTTSGDGTASASTGFASDCDVAVPESTGSTEGGGAPGLPDVPGLPALPALPALPELPLPELPVIGGLLAPVTQALAPSAAAPSGTGSAAPGQPGQPSEPTPGAEGSAACQIPPALGALVDLGGYSTTSTSEIVGGKVVATSRAALGDVRLLGGIVTISGIHTTARTTSDGTTGVPSGRARFGTVTIAGQEFSFGPDGFTAAGRSGTIPGLPDDPAAALATLGITLTLPQPVSTVSGDKAATALSALQVEIDTAVLSPVLSQLPLATLLKDVPFPPEAAVLKSLLGALPNLSPRLVLTLGAAESKVDTVQGIKLLALPDTDTDPDTDPGTDAGDDPTEDQGDQPTGTADGATGGGGTTPPATVTAPAAGDGGATTAASLPPATPVASGLPPLFSIPGLLLLGGIALAAVAGSYLRRLGAAALGGGASCSHGLDSGLPDLRKA